MTKIIEANVISSISIKNQITVPSEVLLTLGLHPRDKVVFVIKSGKVEVRPARNINVEQIFGSMFPSQRANDLKLPSGYKIEYQVQKVIKRVI